MANTDTWVRRMVHLNVFQLIVNSGLAFALLLWFLTLPGGDGTGQHQSWSDPGTQLSTTGANPGMPSGMMDTGDDAPPNGNGAGAPPVGSGGASDGPAALPPTAVSTYMTSTVAKLRAEAEDAGVDVSEYMPTASEISGAAGTGDFFNPKTLRVLRKMRRGFQAAGADMPKIPEEPPGGLDSIGADQPPQAGEPPPDKASPDSEEAPPPSE